MVSYQIIDFEWLSYIVCGLYFSEAEVKFL